MAEGTKKCIYCAEEIQSAAKLCRFCNKEQTEPNAEEVFFEGSVFHRTFLGEHAIYGTVAAIGLALTVWAFMAGGIQDSPGLNSALGYAGLVLLALGVLTSLYRILKTSSIRWKITSQRIQLEEGILSKKIETIELWRVKDINYRQSLWQRIINEADIVVDSMDDSAPLLKITGLTGHRQLFEKLRDAVEKRRRGARVMAVEDHPDKV
jgi:uncharacterized membrane protein YdbT with pleckstrin-like domain